MPPKRKKAGADPQPVPATRSSRSAATRSGREGAETAKTKNTETSKSKVNNSVESSANEAPGGKMNAKSKAKAMLEKVSSESVSESEEPSRKKGKSSTDVPTASKKKAVPSPQTGWKKYSKSAMESLFVAYADEEDASTIGPEGMEKLCTDGRIPMDNAQPLIMAFLLEASELGKIKKEEWVKGMGALQIDSLEKLAFALSEYETLLLQEVSVPAAPTRNKKNAVEPYDRGRNYRTFAADIPKAFHKFYNYVFLLAKAPQERNIDVEIAKAFWPTLLSGKYPIINDLVEFINEKGTLRGVNKDLWEMTLDFCKTFNESLEGYESDGAWPTLLDEFYVWKQAKQPS